MQRKPSNPMHVKAWQAAIATLEPVGGTLEVVPVTERGEAMPRARGRLLAVNHTTGVMTFEKVAGQKQADALVKGVGVEVYAVVGQSRIKASSRVLDVGVFQLNAQTRVMAVQLEPVRDIAPAQRRTSFRLSTTGLIMPPVRITHANWPESQPAVQAMLLDVSERGVGVSIRLDLTLAKRMVGQVFHLQLKLPDLNEPVEVEARAVRVYDAAISTPTLGMQFEFPTIVEQRRVEGLISHFSAEQQRKQLRRVKRVG